MSSAPTPRADAGPGGGQAAGSRGRLGEHLRDAAHSAGSVRILDFVLFALLISSGGLPIQSIGPIPLANLVLALICLRALLDRPRFDLGRWQSLVPVLILGLLYVGGISMFAVHSEGAADWESRLLRLAAVTVLIFVCASGRIDLRSAVLGMFGALVVNVPLFYAGLVQDNYGGYLTGLIGDKNQAGLAYCVVGLLMLWAVRSRGGRVLIVLFSTAALWLTGSRTSIAAYGVGIVWFLLAPYLPIVGKWILGAVSAWFVSLVSEDYSQVGVFSDREGSDLLRARIDAASEVKLHDTGFFGGGLGEAYVTIEDRSWFFHNSYWSALVEGGWPWAVLVVGVTALLLVRPFTGKVPAPQYVAQAAGVALLVCATRLGEVFYTSVWAVAMAVALQLLATPRDPDRSGRLPDPMGRPERGRARPADRTVGRAGTSDGPQGEVP
ncbi:ABC transporter permease [Brachybacterium halotolerans subsp. kimchii]|uniref:O-antigen ligase family protein n=1 Tax=Brachybacterium halotolerans TaxID=2795215 RepID=UPI001E3674D9|nr:ABC transporter permease [Brachybacterium halotolerans]UEJ81132.1 ABC transporter permease [Brachybacterium halotolerans subsp. kimchii]